MGLALGALAVVVVKIPMAAIPCVRSKPRLAPSSCGPTWQRPRRARPQRWLVEVTLGL